MRVLVVEDSLKMSALLAKGLKREGYAVDVVRTGTDAIWMAGENAYDAIVLDVVLDGDVPGLDGFEVCWTCGRVAGRRSSW
jgi:two-component system OmpR family response regulator